jgi:hypothetical protein
MPLGSQQDPYNSESDEGDEDYVPPDENKDDSDSEPSDDEDGVKAPGEVNLPATGVDEEEKKRAREALWVSFQASAAADSSKSPHNQSSQQPRMVKIERKYRFAGEDVIDVVEVPEDSTEAKKWPLWKDPAVNSEEKTDVSTTPPSIPPLTEQAHGMTTFGLTDTASTASSPSNPIVNTSPISVSSPVSGPPDIPKPPTKKPGPRKPKTALAPLPGHAKAKKLTTLDKSAMDWQRHIQTEQQAGSSIKDELDANRRGGGYLEKVEFLKRVEERKEANLDVLKSNKRRRL